MGYVLKTDSVLRPQTSSGIGSCEGAGGANADSKAESVFLGAITGRSDYWDVLGGQAAAGGAHIAAPADDRDHVPGLQAFLSTTLCQSSYRNHLDHR